MNATFLPVVDVDDVSEIDISLPDETSPAVKTASMVCGSISMGIFYATMAADAALFLVGLPLMCLFFLGLFVWALGVVLTLVMCSIGFVVGAVGWIANWRNSNQVVLAITATVLNGAATVLSGAVVVWYLIVVAR